STTIISAPISTKWRLPPAFFAATFQAACSNAAISTRTNANNDMPGHCARRRTIRQISKENALMLFAPVSLARRWAPLLAAALFTVSSALPVAASAAEPAAAPHADKHTRKAHAKKSTHAKTAHAAAAKHAKHAKKTHKAAKQHARSPR